MVGTSMAGSNGQTGTCGCAASSEPADTGRLPGSSMASIVVSGKHRCNRHQSGRQQCSRHCSSEQAAAGTSGQVCWYWLVITHQQIGTGEQNAKQWHGKQAVWHLPAGSQALVTR